MNAVSQLHAIIVDDEKRGISALKQLVEKFIPEVKVIAEFLDPGSAVEAIETQKPEILFLDIDMPGMNGFDLLDALAWKNFSLVFTTAHEEYGLRALKNNAIDYLLKPISRFELRNTIDRIIEKRGEEKITVQFNFQELFFSLGHASRAKLLVNTFDGIEALYLDEILYLESRSNYTKILTTEQKELVTRKTLKEFEQQLCNPGSDFLRVHHSFIINLKKVVRYLKTQEEIVLMGEIHVPLSKARRDVFFTWLNAW